MAKLAKCRVELFMEETRTNVQIKPIPLKELKEEITSKGASYTKTKIKIDQYLQENESYIRASVQTHERGEERG